MIEFTELEQAAMRCIFSETPEWAGDLEQQLECAAVSERENTGGGFFTTIVVADEAPRLNTTYVLGNETHARVVGLEHGMGFVLFLKKGAMHLLEGYACGPENTLPLDLTNLSFEVFKMPITRIL